MARSMQYLETYVAQLQHFTVFGLVNVESCFGSRAEYNGCAGFFSKVNVSRNEVGVEMRLKDVFEFAAVFSQFFEVRLGFPQWINDDCFALTFDIIRCLS